MTSAAALEALKRSALFGALDDATLGELLAVGLQRTYRRGEIIFRQGDPGNNLYLVTEGRVKIVINTPDGEEMVLAALEPAATFGEVSLLDGGTRSASALPMQPTRLLSIARPDFVKLAQEHPAVLEKLHELVGHLVRRLTEQAADLAFLDLHGRLAKLLVQLIEERSASGLPVEELELGMTQSELAGRIGGSRQSVNYVLHSLERGGYLQVRGQRVTVQRIDLLRKRAGL